MHRHSTTLVLFPSHPSANKIATERVVWYLWGNSLVLAIPNDAGQSDHCIVTCLPKSSDTRSYKIENHLLLVVSDGKVERKLRRDAVRHLPSISAGTISNMKYLYIIETRTFTCETHPNKVRACFFLCTRDQAVIC